MVEVAVALFLLVDLVQMEVQEVAVMLDSVDLQDQVVLEINQDLLVVDQEEMVETVLAVMME
jgi:hypothetical protein